MNIRDKIYNNEYEENNTLLKLVYFWSRNSDKTMFDILFNKTFYVDYSLRFKGVNHDDYNLKHKISLLYDIIRIIDANRIIKYVEKKLPKAKNGKYNKTIQTLHKYNLIKTKDFMAIGLTTSLKKRIIKFLQSIPEHVLNFHVFFDLVHNWRGSSYKKEEYYCKKWKRIIDLCHPPKLKDSNFINYILYDNKYPLLGNLLSKPGDKYDRYFNITREERVYDIFLIFVRYINFEWAYKFFDVFNDFDDNRLKEYLQAFVKYGNLGIIFDDWKNINDIVYRNFKLKKIEELPILIKWDYQKRIKSLGGEINLIFYAYNVHVDHIKIKILKYLLPKQLLDKFKY